MRGRERDPQLVGPDLEEPVQARALEDRPVRRQRVLAGRREHDEAADEEREDGRHQRDDDAAGALREVEPARDVRRGLAARGRLSTVPPPSGGVGLAHAAFRPPPVIAMPSSSSETLGGYSPTIRALEDDEDPVGEREDLVQLERDEQDAAALVALLDEPPVDELDRAHVEAARRLRGDQHLRVAVDLAREDDLLLVAAREAAGVRVRPAAADVELLQQDARLLDQALRIEPAEARRGRMIVVVQGEVLGEREVEHEPAPLPVLGDVAEPASRHCGRPRR